jgi:hypothetical protein
MRSMTKCPLVLGFIALLCGTAFADIKMPGETVADGCEKELATFCRGVTPGEGRILACLYAFSDKLSPRCESVLFENATQLEKAMNSLSYECREDLKRFCNDVKYGDRRLFECLEKEKDQVSDQCRQAVSDIALRLR